MTGQSPPAPATVKIPARAASYTPATIDPELRSAINGVLLQEGHVRTIQERLLHGLNADRANWPTNVENHALSLLRSGEVSSFPELLRRVLVDVRQETEQRRSEAAAAAEANGSGDKANGEGGKKGSNGAEKKAAGELALPESVVEEALKVTRECLDDIAYLEN
ncbi:uncharacterized protein DNG_05655 [Cephalotrichum gorgonifer]|uniref:Uncharacterized protein n=1 Tax=Cephalotrichum gorgonifer TaxID=2041049 RepID=A0AAE8N019_9PEZI|nr:uncharacterized protein DNG_05655 [Cephalotrichum gorgonifer]